MQVNKYSTQWQFLNAGRFVSIIGHGGIRSQSASLIQLMSFSNDTFWKYEVAFTDRDYFISISLNTGRIYFTVLWFQDSQWF